MHTDPLPYDRWIAEALRGIVKRALALTAAEGLPGDHHFYVTFRTREAGVDIPAYLRAAHPNDMTIVLQHQFHDLEVDEEAFAVTLSFKGKTERLRIPFAAVTSFADPSVNFGIQLTRESAAEAADERPRAPREKAKKPRKKAAEEKEQAADDKSGEVIALDAFRKK